MTSLKARLEVYGQLLHFYQPLGVLSTLFPTLITLWLATAGRPHVSLILIVFLIAMLSTMGSLAIGDWANALKGEESPEYDIIPELKSGKVRPWEALALGLIIYALATALVVMVGSLTAVAVQVGALALIMIYLFLRHVLELPYLLMSWYLGLIYSTGIPLTFALVFDRLDWYVWAYVGVNMFLVVACDVQETIRSRAPPSDTQSEVEQVLRPESLDVPFMVFSYGVFFLGTCALCYFFQLGAIAWVAIGVAALYALVWSFGISKFSKSDRRMSSGFSGEQVILILLFVGLVLDYAIRLHACPVMD